MSSPSASSYKASARAWDKQLEKDDKGSISPTF